MIEEFTTSKYYKEEIKPKFSKMNSNEINIVIMEESCKQLMKAMESGNEIILVDRSINDRQIWNYRRYHKGEMPEDLYLQTRDKNADISKKFIDFLVITYADPLVSLKRDYKNSLALEERSFLNTQNIEEYNRSLQDLEILFSESVTSSCQLDTSLMSVNEVAIEVASNIMPVMRKQYIKSFKDQYHLK